MRREARLQLPAGEGARGTPGSSTAQLGCSRENSPAREKSPEAAGQRKARGGRAQRGNGAQEHQGTQNLAERLAGPLAQEVESEEADGGDLGGTLDRA